MAGSNPYLTEVEKVLPRVLALFNTDVLDPTRGVGDRLYWAWKFIDFPNGTFQGAAHGLARLLASGTLPVALDPARIANRIDGMFDATAAITRKDGSLEESFPYERSFCVTALVAYDLLSAIEFMPDRAQPSQNGARPEVVAPLIRFICGADETHGMISNHLAAAVAALVKWDRLTGDKSARRRAEILLARILKNQSEEGWFSEYDGADPGYQSQCTGYLADVQPMIDGPSLVEALHRSVRFIWHFAHPDGSFAGLYGSRNTRFYHPGGIEVLAEPIPEAASLAEHMRLSIAGQSVVTLSAMDDLNLIPMFNSYCQAAASLDQRPVGGSSGLPPVLPALRDTPLREHFPDAGLLVDGGPRHYTVVSTHKGGVVYHFRKDGHGATIDPGIVLEDRQGRCYTGQTYEPTTKTEFDGDDNTLVVFATIRRLVHPLPSAWKFLVLRLLNLTVMRTALFSSAVKWLLVNYLIRPKRRPIGICRREIRLGHDLEISDIWQGSESYRPITPPGPFVAIHMASRGYWQAQDDLQPRLADRRAGHADAAGPQA